MILLFIFIIAKVKDMTPLATCLEANKRVRGSKENGQNSE